jgi:hypothetical protein
MSYSISSQMLLSRRHYSSSRASAQVCVQAAVFVGLERPKALAMTVLELIEQLLHFQGLLLQT